MADPCRLCGRIPGSKVSADLRVEGLSTCPTCGAEWPTKAYFDKPSKADTVPVRYQDVPEKPDAGPCGCPECCEARGEEPTPEMVKRHHRAMSKRLETK